MPQLIGCGSDEVGWDQMTPLQAIGWVQDCSKHLFLELLLSEPCTSHNES